jgi:hypothetical protein
MSALASYYDYYYFICHQQQMPSLRGLSVNITNGALA